MKPVKQIVDLLPAAGLPSSHYRPGPNRSTVRGDRMSGTAAPPVSTRPGWAASLTRRQLDSYPDTRARITYLAITVLATMTLYYELYVGDSVTPYILTKLHMSFPFFVLTLPFGAQEYLIWRIAGRVVLGVALVGLRELSPQLRDQLMVTMHDRALIEAKAKGMTEADIEAALRHPFRQLLKPDIIVSSIAVSIMLLIYYTAVGFAAIYLTTVFGFSVNDATGLGNWNWGFNVFAAVLVGVVPDRS